MIKILDHTKPLVQLVNDSTNGIGRIEPLECLVTEELNGIYEAQLVILQSDRHFNDIALNGLLEIEAGEVIGKQIFRIYFISKPIDGKILINAQHISYDLNKVAVEPFSATGAIAVKNGMLSHIMGSYPFDMMTDILNASTTFTLDIPRSFRECLGGWEGSILDRFRCEYEWDNLLVKMLAHRGTDEGVRIAYGKNLTDFKQEENIQSVYTSVLGYAVVNEQTYMGEVYHKVVSNLPKVKIVDFSSDFGDTAPTTAQLTQKAQDYATSHSIEVPSVSINIAFVPLYQTEEYKNIAPLERVALGDTVHVYFEKLNVEATSRVVKTVWNALLHKYESVELGNTKANLTTLLDDAVQEARESITIDAGFVETEMNEMSQLIINGLGLHRTLVPLSTGGHRMYLHNKPTLADSDTQYVITASGFMISTDYGQTWNSGWDVQGNAVTNALSTITLKALEIYGSYIQGSTIVFGDPSDTSSKYITAAPYSSGDVVQGVSFDGTGYIRMRPQEQFLVTNLDPSNNTLNQFLMTRNPYPYTSLFNYDPENMLLANFITLDSRYYVSTAPDVKYNRTVINNYNTLSGTRYGGNSIVFNAREASNTVSLRNYKLNSNSLANEFSLSSIATGSTGTLTNYRFPSGKGSTANVISLATYNANDFIQLGNYSRTSYTSGTTEEYPLVNRIRLEVFDNNRSVIGISNMICGSSGAVRSNFIELNASETNSTQYFNNYKAGHGTSYANRIMMYGVPLSSGGTNTLQIVNYDVDGDNISDSIVMSKSTDNNYLELTLKRGTSDVAQVYLRRDSSNKVTVGIATYGSSTFGYTGAKIELDSTGAIKINGTPIYLSGGYVRY